MPGLTLFLLFGFVEAFETEPVDRLDERNWIKMQSDNYGDPEHRDIIYDQLGTTFSSQVDRQGVVYNRTYVYTWDATAGKYVGVRERLVSTVGDNKVLYNKITGYDDIVPEFKWEDGQAYRLRSYSMRASASLAINGDESLIYYQSLPQQVSKIQPWLFSVISENYQIGIHVRVKLNLSLLWPQE